MDGASKRIDVAGDTCSWVSVRTKRIVFLLQILSGLVCRVRDCCSNLLRGVRYGIGCRSRSLSDLSTGNLGRFFWRPFFQGLLKGISTSSRTCRGELTSELVFWPEYRPVADKAERMTFSAVGISPSWQISYATRHKIRLPVTS